MDFKNFKLRLFNVEEKISKKEESSFFLISLVLNVPSSSTVIRPAKESPAFVISSGELEPVIRKRPFFLRLRSMIPLRYLKSSGTS